MLYSWGMSNQIVTKTRQDVRQTAKLAGWGLDESYYEDTFRHPTHEAVVTVSYHTHTGRIRYGAVDSNSDLQPFSYRTDDGRWVPCRVTRTNVAANVKALLASANQAVTA
jgi:hypothetical protein